MLLRAMLPGSGVEAASARANAMRAAFAATCRFKMGHPVNATTSGGVAVSPDAGLSVTDLLQPSDEALYVAKADGRNRISAAHTPRPEGERSNVVRVA
jgi:GGDEF domain-containing protein